ncbi:MAG: aminomethyltransferase family protein [Phycisphaerae bacterium]|nr:aminomethyltransferase family protein [Phycisphaerae bacterium]
MDNDLLKTSLHDKHVAAEAVMGEEGGWAVPMSYSGALEEASLAHKAAVLFDLSHLGRIRIRGDGALELLQRVCTADVARQEDDTVLHTLLCNERGGILDECRLIRLVNFWVLTCNAMNREKLLEHLLFQKIPDARVDDQTFKVGQLAVLGPTAQKILNHVLPISVDNLQPGQAKMGSLMIANYIAARTSLAGGWGLEVMVPTMFLARAWDYVMKQTGENALAPAGMAAWDVLRIEAGRCRYGHELHEAVDPITAGLRSSVSFDHDFLGAEALKNVLKKGPSRRRVLMVGGKTAPSGKPVTTSIPLMGTNVIGKEDRHVGEITSATFSPTYERPLAMAYVATDVAEPQTTLRVENAGAWRIEKVFE